MIGSLADVAAIEARPYEETVEPKSMADLFRIAAERYGDRAAIIELNSADPDYAPTRWSYRHLWDGIRLAASLFRGLGLREDEAVATLLPNIHEHHFALWGAELAARACAINYLLQPDHIAELIERARAKVLVALGPDPELDIWSKVPAILAKAPCVEHVFFVGDDPKDGTRARDFALELAKTPLDFARALGRDTIAAYFHTGGTTGAPKLAQHTHGNQVHTSWSAGHYFGTGPGDVTFNGYPLFHVAGSIVHGSGHFWRGATVILPTRLGFRNTAFVRNFWRFAEKYRATLLTAMPATIATLLNTPLDGADISSARAMLTGGTPIPAELAAEFERVYGKPVRCGYGMTESAGLIALTPAAGAPAGTSVGWRLPYTEVQAVTLGADGESFERVCAPGETGVIVVRGPQVVRGYTDAKRNKGTFRADGWLISGDLGHVDGEGRVVLTGRAKDLIIRGGHNIDPAMIEEIAAEHPALLLVAAVGEPDAYAGELPLLFAVKRPGAAVSEREVLDFLASRIHERPALPKRIVFVDAMPLTALGKIYKPQLRRLATERRIGEALAPLAANGVKVRVEGVEEGGVISVRIHVEGGEPAQIESEIAKLLRDYAVERAIVPLALGRGGRG